MRRRASKPPRLPKPWARHADWFAEQGQMDAIGIASFGPLSLTRLRPQWGHILATPKPHWSGADIAGPLARRLAARLQSIPTSTVLRWPNIIGARGRVRSRCSISPSAPAIGGGAVVDGRIVQGISHPEMGHFRTPRHPA